MREGEKRPDIKFGESTPIDYRVKLMSLINTGRRDIIQIDTNTASALKNEVHRFGQVDEREWGAAEQKILEDIRLDICQSFGVPFDDEHVVRDHYDHRGRVVIAFFVLRNQLTREAWYADGATDHAHLFNELCRRAGVDSNEAEEVSGEFDKKYLIAKGFLDNNRFKDFPETRKSMEQALEVQGDKIETPENWFISGFADSPHELGTISSDDEV